MRPKQISIAAFSIAVFFSAHAYAGPFDAFGAGARGSAMGAQTADAQGAAAIYYNVGALAHTEPGVTIGAFATANQAQILLKDRPAGYDIPDFGGETPTLPSNQTLNARGDTEEIDALYAITFGGVTSLGIENLRLGILGFLPTSELVALQTHYNDERERLFSNKLYWEFIDRPTRRFDIEAGIAYRITDWFSFGVGGTFLTGADVATNVYLEDPTDQSNIEINSDVKTGNKWGLLAGAVFTLPYRLKVGVSYRDSVWFRVKGGNNLQLEGIDEDERPRQELDWTPKFSPATLATGITWGVGDVTLALDGRLVFWSEYRDTHSERIEFDNVINTRLGVEYDYSDATQVRFGLGFDPTPVPAQTGRTNYVDNSKGLISVGSAHRFEISEVEFVASWFLQFQVLFERQTDKAALDDYPACADGVESICDEVPDSFIDPETGQPAREAQGLQTGNPGFPGFVAGGWIGALGAEVTF